MTPIMKPSPIKQPREHLIHLERVFWIDQQVRSNRYPNARTIAEHFEVTPKTAQRSLDFMRDRLRLPLGYSSEHRGWYYTEPAFALPAIELTEGDLVAILLAEKLSRQYRGTAIGKQVEQAFSKVLSAMTNTVSIDLAALAEAHSFEAAAGTDLDPDLFRRLGRAAIARRRIEMTYFTAARGEMTRRRCDPLHLRNRLGEWYVIAFDHHRNEVRDSTRAAYESLPSPTNSSSGPLVSIWKLISIQVSECFAAASRSRSRLNLMNINHAGYASARRSTQPSNAKNCRTAA